MLPEAKIEEEKNDEKPMSDCLDDIPCEIDKEDHVRRYVTALPTTTAHTNATSINSMDHQQNTSVANVSTIPLTASTPVAHGIPGVIPSVLRPSATPFSPLHAQSTMPTFSLFSLMRIAPLSLKRQKLRGHFLSVL